MRRRGYDVQAMPLDYKNPYQEKISRDIRSGWRIPISGKVPNQVFYDGDDSEDGLIGWLENSVKAGERYFLRVTWDRKDIGGHVVVVERDAKGVFIYDPQIDRDFRDYEIGLKYANNIHLTRKDAPGILRVDNLAPVQDAVDNVLVGVKKQGRRRKNEQG